ncbi:19534_t:CDS:1, partial [Dentiscutata erythropus]
RIYQIWRGEEANRVLWDQPIFCSYDDDSNQNTKYLDISFANITNSAVDILHIESQPLDNISTE